MASKGYGYTALTGGGAGALDAIDGSILVAGDFAFGGAASSKLGATFVVAASGSAADGITVIIPLVNAGSKRWHLVREQTKDGVDVYDGTNIAHLQFTANELELYSERHSGITKVMVEDAGGNKETAIKATGAGAVELYYDNSKKLATTTIGVTVTGGLIETVPSFSRKNFIINGNMDIWQRGTSYTFTTGQSGYNADRWSFSNGTDGTVLLTKNSGAPTIAQAGYKNVYGNMFQFSVADAALAAGQYAYLTQKIEGYDVSHLMGQEVTLSFWVYSKITGIFCVAFKNSGGDRAYVAEYTVNQADTFEKKTITLTMHDGTSGAWDYTNGVGLNVIFCAGSGTTYKTANANTWEAGNYIATSNQTNLAGTINNYMSINSVQLELGAYATPFEYRPLAKELALCQRYYEKSYNLSEAPGSNTGNSYGMPVYFSPAASANYPSVPYSVRKKSAGAVTIYRNDGTSGAIDGGTNPAAGAVDLGETGFKVNSTFAADTLYKWHWAADAEL